MAADAECAIIGDEVGVHAGEAAGGVGGGAGFAIGGGVAFIADPQPGVVVSVFAADAGEGLPLAVVAAGGAESHCQSVAVQDANCAVFVVYYER